MVTRNDAARRRPGRGAATLAAALLAMVLGVGGVPGAASAAPASEVPEETTVASVATGVASAEAGVRGSGRVIVYYQKQFVDGSSGAYISPLPLVTENTGVDVVNLAAVHMNENELRLNDLLPDDPLFGTMWRELGEIQDAGVAVVGMIGGAQNATWQSLSTDYETQYQRLHDFVATYSLDGIDLDVETETDVAVVEHVIADLARDFGDGFLITLSPVTAALVGEDNLSGFDYDQLYAASGESIDWFNTQFYCGWGEPTAADYDEIVSYQAERGAGIPASKIVMAVLTNPENCGDG